MSISPTSVKPAFSAAEEEPLLSKPISKLAIVSLVLGVLGMLTPFLRTLQVVPLAAAILGLVCSFQLSRSSSGHSGAWIANVGLFLGLMSFSWFAIANKTIRDNMALHGSEFASHFLEVLADGNYYVAAELQQPIASRQLAGLDLKSFYESYTGGLEDMANEDNSPSAQILAKKRLIDLRSHAVTKYVRQYPNAKWISPELNQIAYKPQNVQIVKVTLSNSEDPQHSIQVVLERQSIDQDGKTFAEWHVKDMVLL